MLNLFLNFAFHFIKSPHRFAIALNGHDPAYFFLRSTALARLAAAGAYLAARRIKPLRAEALLACPRRRKAEAALLRSKIGKDFFLPSPCLRRAAALTPPDLFRMALVPLVLLAINLPSFYGAGGAGVTSPVSKLKYFCTLSRI